MCWGVWVGMCVGGLSYLHNKIPAIFSSPLGVLKGGGRRDVVLGLGTKGKGESSDGGRGNDKRLPASKGSPLLSWGR